MALTPEQLDDFVNLTLKRFEKVNWADISLQHQEYVAMSRMVSQKTLTERGGEQISWRLQVKNTGNARNTGMYATDVTAVEDVTVAANVPWTMQTGNYSYDVYEPLFQSGPETIIEELKIREHDCLNSMTELMEQNLWTAPTSTTDYRPMGIPFWIQKDATTTPGGAFNGGNPSGFTSGAAGVNATTYPYWKNWTFGFTNVTEDDFLTKLRKAFAFTNFRAPNPYPELRKGPSNWECFTTYTVLGALERLAETRNDNLGSDVIRYAGAVTVKQQPIMWVPYLEANDSSNPIYGINWSVFRPFVKSGANMRRNPVKQAAHQHTVREVHFDHWCNYVCYNRRYVFVGSQA